MNKRLHFISCLTVCVVALGIRLGLAFRLGLSQPMESDAYYYLHLGHSLAHGQGYVLQDGFWPNQPSLQRLPGWPFAVSLALRAVPQLPPDMVMRLLGGIIDSLNAGLVVWLAWLLLRRPSVAWVAGLAYAIHPSALFLVQTGESEPLFVLLCLAGFLCVLKGGRCHIGAAAFFGLACLVRVNYVLWLGVAAVLALLTWSRSREGGGRPSLRCMVLMTVLFMAPAAAWTVRNLHVCGHFPVLSTLRGQTFYGGNNDVVANSMDMWGYWLWPDGIPGVTPAADLVKSMSEYELDTYYFSKGLEYVKTHWFAMPRLLLGKLVRAYVPVPWKPNWVSYGVGLYRAVLYGFALMGLCAAWAGLPWAYRIWFTAMVAVNVLTVLIFWGCFRFAFDLEPFLLPFAALFAADAVRKCGLKGTKR